jgi:hypothetical protein
MGASKKSFREMRARILAVTRHLGRSSSTSLSLPSRRSSPFGSARRWWRR